ncbi:MAG: Efflux pump periplasmic linker BepD [Candidatus Moanabacter tarae]|uniref:Efflux pump periplasmic linker BepD n=1 Tax=Candidatus Moanibacter tarae TaxID=2200854 RepID=A0A2Z4ADI9_9BACT|nr:MAG: Efflux pump periplasmic linker BepD [Candidatus Moanabacter tarae]
MNSRTRGVLRSIILSFVILGVAVLFAIYMDKLRSRPEEKEDLPVLPRVEVVRVQLESHRLEVVTHGTVQPRTETSLTSEVSGVIVAVSPNFFPGKFFHENEVLLEIDSTEYRALRAEARSRLAQARLVFKQESAFAEQARDDWNDLGLGEGGDLALRKPQVFRAKMEMEAAEAALEVAERNLRLTTIRAPYTGRVREKSVDIGQVVAARVTPLARIYSVDVAEVRLPISAEEAAFVELPEQYQDDINASDKPEVILEFDYAGRRISRLGFVDRVEGAIEVSTRQTVVVAKVLKPFSRAGASDEPPLKPGQFVRARILGHLIKDAAIIPRGSLHNQLVYVIDAQARLQIRPVRVVRKGIDKVVVAEGLNEGDLVCITPLVFAIEGMEVIVENISGDALPREAKDLP